MIPGIVPNTLVYRDDSGDVLALINAGAKPSPGKTGRIWFELYPYPKMCYDTGNTWVELEGVQKLEKLMYFDLDRKRIGVLTQLPQYTLDVRGSVGASDYFAFTASEQDFVEKPDVIKVYLTKSGTSPSKTLTWKALTEDGNEMILSSLIV